MEDLNKKWDALIKKLEKQFDDEMTLKGILYLIGIQELNFESLSKNLSLLLIS